MRGVLPLTSLCLGEQRVNVSMSGERELKVKYMGMYAV